VSEKSKEESSAPAASETPEPEAKKGKLFPDLEELQQEIDRRIRDNKRFLERFLDEDFIDDEETDAAEDEGEDFEEL
jgi:hypothetical protein